MHPTACHQFCLLYYDSSINSEASGKGCDIRELTKAWVWEGLGFCPFTWLVESQSHTETKLVEPPALLVLQSSSPVTLQSQIAQGVPRSGGPSENEMVRLIRGLTQAWGKDSTPRLHADLMASLSCGMATVPKLPVLCLWRMVPWSAWTPLSPEHHFL